MPKKLPQKDEVCFAIEPLAENTVAFDVLSPTPKTARTGVSDLVSALDQETYTADLTHLVSYPTRFSTSPSFQDAANWTEGRLTAMGYAASQTSVTVPGVGHVAQCDCDQTWHGNKSRTGYRHRPYG